MELSEHLMAAGALKGTSCCIITSYADQKKAYTNVIITSSLKVDELIERMIITGAQRETSYGIIATLSLLWEDMVPIHTVDSRQGGQANLIMGDWDVKSGEVHELGCASDSRRANVALTRAPSCLVVVADGRLIKDIG
ncbi:hypothetical protein ASPBRDRAFT_191297 [Aspergillus brasiliensis CBS 101740]|uniref:DNA2/NAM7 helicase-like C-terminal domain-containing protein n=1 Tax=Aspergillus brasiliensis (strain CBS 101740 / IMI 381727 / IBT 21946) TaxID=767769 RepID=A0A1L9V295_ASPBC|nr:hypothetical protein ASPBRDRAFT_191297 [Aspergillus brasiliensis CBS 101740]